MSLISRSVDKYTVPFNNLNQINEHQVNCKKADLYRCAVTVGNPSFISLRAIKKYGFWCILFTSVIDKCSLVASNLIDVGGHLRRSSIYNTYVTDKKREVSYNLGMVFAKLHAEKLLGIRNLVHLEFLKQQGALTFVPQTTTKRPKEPDLVGQDGNGTWHIFEAKGTTYENMISRKVLEAKEQAKQIASIQGQLPGTRSVAATYIGDDRIFTCIEDPSDSGSTVVEFDKIDFIKSYYAPFLICQQNGYPNAQDRTIDGIPVKMFDIGNKMGCVSIGIVSEVAECIFNSRFNELSDELSNIGDLSERGGDQYSFGLDGFVVGFKPNRQGLLRS
ncbi:hypothetical protein [Acetobacter cerevisiae]|nr:hypothetical protein [Acetobacter cerevisiae]